MPLPSFSRPALTIEDFSFHSQLDKKAVLGLFDLTFLAKKENVISLCLSLGPSVFRRNLLTFESVGMFWSFFLLWHSYCTENVGEMVKPNR